MSGVAGLTLAVSTGHGQAMSRMATTVEAVARYPAFFHDKVLALVGTPTPVAGGAHAGLPIEVPRTFVLAPRTGQVPERTLEFRGRLFDIGRMLSDDSRLAPLNLPPIITSLMGDRWPAREQLFILSGASWQDPPDRNTVSMRAIALSPSAYEGRAVTLRGRFRGRNLLGDLPAWPRQSEWDFVLQAADAAVWVAGRRPRGSGFDLNTTNRAHTGRWLEVTGRLEVRDSLPVLLADTIRTAAAEEDAVEVAEPPAPPPPAPELVFSAPTAGELGVPRDVVVRFQFSRPMREASFAGRVRVSYPEDPARPVPALTVTYRPGPMAIEIRFEGPLAPGAEVQVELLEGILSAEGPAFGGATLRFTTSGLSR